jgi:polysaccharide export outer membrane protein
MKNIVLFLLAGTAVIFVFLMHPFPAAAQQEYVVGEGDLLKITVYDHPDLTTETRVAGDGKITFPLIGEVDLSNLTVSQSEKTIARMLGDGYIINPHVSILVTEFKSKKVTILGEVVKPGVVILRGAYTLMEALSDAGGITPDAGDTIYIQRKIFRPAGDKKIKEEVSVLIDTKKLFEEGDVTANVPVQDGDSIYVPRASFVYVNGEVKSPGKYKIEKDLTVLKSITLAGGFTPKASERRTRIIRKTEKGEEEIKAKMDDLVMPDDIIFVPESWF